MMMTSQGGGGGRSSQPPSVATTHTEAAQGIKVACRALNQHQLKKPPRVAQTVHRAPARPSAPMRASQIGRYIEGCFWDQK